MDGSAEDLRTWWLERGASIILTIIVTTPSRVVAVHSMSSVVVVQTLTEAVVDILVLMVLEEAVPDHEGFVLRGVGMDQGLPLLARGPCSLFLGGLLKPSGRSLWPAGLHCTLGDP